MRKKLTRLLMLALACGLLFAACDKDKPEGDGGGNSTPGGNVSPSAPGDLPSVVTFLDHESRKQMVLQIAWEGSRIHELTISKSNESGFMQPVVDITPTYDNMRIASMFIYSYEESLGITTTCNYQDNKLVKIEIPHSDPVLFDYDASNNLRSVTVDGETINMRWNNGNISWIGNGDGSVNLTYDNTHNPLNEIFAAIFPSWNANINNIVSITNMEGEVLRPQYTRVGDRVSLCRIPSLTQTLSICYKYTDGTGEAPETYFRDCRRVNVESSGNGYAYGGGYYATGSTATLVAEPRNGAEFSEWYFSDGYIVSENPYSFTVTGNTSVYAFFYN
ncbi:MAG: hypothetical protein IKP83_04595 [Bacteroidales bacterium]|nr:hypothetical protein [Bacteroidales bacterium]